MNYILALASALPLLVAAARHKDSFNRYFILGAFLFAITFYCLPLAASADSGMLTYLGSSTLFRAADRNNALIAMLLFSLGFLAWDLTYRAKSESPDRPPPQRAIRTSKFLANALPVLVCLSSLYLIYYLISGEFYDYTRLVRAKEIEGAYLLTVVLLSLYYINCMMLIFSLTRKRYALSLLWFTLAILLIVNFGGRVQVGIVLLIPLVHFIRHRRLLLAMGIAGGALLLPIILEGKEIIAAAVAYGDTGSAMRAIENAYSQSLDIDALLNNFSHPFVSYYYSPSLVERIGYRYFWDIPQGFLFYFRLVGIDFGDSLTYYNTEMLISQRESIIPPGYLAFGYVQANLVGVFLMGIVYRLAGRLAEVVRNQVSRDAPAADFFLAFLAANTFYIGEIRGLVLTFIFPCLLLYAVARLTGQHEGSATST